MVAGAPVPVIQSVRPPSWERIAGGRGGLRVRGEIEQGPVLVALEEAIELVDEPVVLGGIGLRAVLDVGADENQAAGAAFAVGGGEANLGTADLAGEGVALASLSLLQLFFLCLEFLLQGFLPGECTSSDQVGHFGAVA